MALHFADYVVTEAGFGADLGAEKFIDIKCREENIEPDAVIIVATIKALKYNGGVPKDKVKEENLEALEKGLLNKYVTDTDEEIELVRNKCSVYGVDVKVSEVWEKGGEGGIELAQEVVRLCNIPSNVHYTYELEWSIKEKIEAICNRIYGAGSVVYSRSAQKEIAELERLGYGDLPICMAKTQYSLSDDETKLGRPEGFEMTIREVIVSAGAGFIVALTGTVMKMPGLPKVPAAENIDITEEGLISGLF